MKRWSFAAFGLALGVATVSPAAELYTPPFTSGEASDVVLCKLVNVSSKPREVEVRIFGNQLLIEESGPETLAPGQLTVTATPGGFNHAYCHFSVKGDKNTVRAGGSVLNSPSQVDAFVVRAE